jgi:hypothetical protein
LRLFVLEKIKNEVDRQLAAATIINKSKIFSGPKSPLLTNPEEEDEEDDNDFEYEDYLNLTNLLEDLTNNPNECAFPSSRQNQCLTNQQVYKLLHNKIDLMKTSKLIEQQLHKPNEQICTSIDLSMYQII